MTALDTSVCVPALLDWHEAHDVCRRAAVGASIPAHALLEIYSVLTRLPAPHRVDRATARSLLAARFGDGAVLTVPPALQRSAVERLASEAVEGGAVYDGIIGLTAAHHGEVLLTRDGRATRTYRALDVEHRFV